MKKFTEWLSEDINRRAFLKGMGGIALGGLLGGSAIANENELAEGIAKALASRDGGFHEAILEKRVGALKDLKLILKHLTTDDLDVSIAMSLAYSSGANRFRDIEARRKMEQIHEMLRSLKK